MYKNEVLEHLWQVKEEIAKENDYDIRKLCDSLNKKTLERLKKKANESLVSTTRI
jgi:hypothetical protein